MAAKETPKTYDCVFCRRGFTNAQALGGHMNIHRREKAAAIHKGKGKTVGASISSATATAVQVKPPPIAAATATVVAPPILHKCTVSGCTREFNSRPERDEHATKAHTNCMLLPFWGHSL
jgi:hypothetical protein